MVGHLAQVVVRRRFPNLRGDEHNDVTKFAFGVVGFVFAFFIGFVVSAMWGQISHADSIVRAEGAAGAQLARDSHIFDQPDRDRIRQSLLEYQQAAITEWGEINAGRSYPRADEALDRLYAALETIQPRSEAQKTLLSSSFGNLDDMSKGRAERILQAATDTGPPWSLWAVIFVTSGLLLGCAIIYGVERPANHYAMVAIIGTLVGAQLFLVVELSHPYVGAVSTVPEPLHQVVRTLQGYPWSPRRPAPGLADHESGSPALSPAKAKNMADHGPVTATHARSIMLPGILLGAGLGGFLDGILLHQVLQWHHLLTSTDTDNIGLQTYPADTVHGLQMNTLWDGVFHAVTWLLVLIGLGVLDSRVTRSRGRVFASRVLWGWILVGWGVFNLVEGVLSHHILGIHHVRSGPHQLWWDLGFLALGAVLVVVGRLLAREARPTGS